MNAALHHNSLFPWTFPVLHCTQIFTILREIFLMFHAVIPRVSITEREQPLLVSVRPEPTGKSVGAVRGPECAGE